MKKIEFEKWYDKNFEELSDQYISQNPEEFPTDECYSELENNMGFQEYCEEEYKKVE